MGSDESHFNVSLTVRGKVKRRCPQTRTFEEKGEPKRGIEPKSSAYRPNGLPLGQTGSPMQSSQCFFLFESRACQNITVSAASFIAVDSS